MAYPKRIFRDNQRIQINYMPEKETDGYVSGDGRDSLGQSHDNS